MVNPFSFVFIVNPGQSGLQLNIDIRLPNLYFFFFYYFISPERGGGRGASHRVLVTTVYMSKTAQSTLVNLTPKKFIVVQTQLIPFNSIIQKK